MSEPTISQTDAIELARTFLEKYLQENNGLRALEPMPTVPEDKAELTGIELEGVEAGENEQTLLTRFRSEYFFENPLDESIHNRCNTAIRSMLRANKDLRAFSISIQVNQ